MSRGPLPSTLCFLSQVPAHKAGAKVRFLGCVTSYDTKTASARLGHLYPKGTNVLVSVDVRLVLETIEPDITNVGQWVNVIGYVVDGDATDQARGVDAHVQALMMWSTGPLDVHEYEKAVEDGLIVVRSTE
ncbi:hypothetical protein C2857_002340 [Epichloe festucae Fl1]|uniref:Telomere capping, CST complex subunit-domain-containing protein n=1 Tax=Epichloe festucae (strain Fl1) TaxID=877507 RepID=A0A7S9KUH7_EPIFF|nr:hypothetical protein C2857_002340 [Epichloe festucae Fl1]